MKAGANNIIFSLFLMLLFYSGLASAQQKTIVHRTESWSALFMNIKLNDKYAVWNDFHFVPNSFFIARHGLTRQLNEKVTVTAGYAWLLTATPFTENLVRFEHRPWGQIELIQPIANKINYRFRLRYDYRIRKGLSQTEVLDNYISYSRLRFMNSIRFPLFKLKQKTVNLNLMNETLLNFGSQISGNNLDQNRIWIMFGYRVGDYTIMPGYLQRFIPSSPRNFINHGIALWILR
jgi:hypothetical protein